MVSTSFIASSIMALMSAASFSERKPPPSCCWGVPVDGSIVASLLGLEMGVPFLMPNWAWVGRRKESIVVRRKIDRSDLMVLVMVMVMG